MFLHLGNGISVRTKEVIAIQDYAIFQNGTGKNLLEKQRLKGKVVNTLAFETPDNGESIKSLILTEDAIYLSVISPLTLKRRSELAFNTTEFREILEKTTESSDTMIVK